MLGDLPFIGPAFSSVSYQTRESELVILVTPRLVHPMDRAKVRSVFRDKKPARPTIMNYSWKTFWRPLAANGRCGTVTVTTPHTSAIRQRLSIPCAGNVCTGVNGTCMPAAGTDRGTGLPTGGSGPVMPPPAPRVPAIPVSLPNGSGIGQPLREPHAVGTGNIPGRMPGIPTGGANQSVPLPPLPPAGA